MNLGKVLIFVLLALLLEAGDCWKIKDKDAKEMCKAETGN